MNASLALPLHLLRRQPGLVTRFLIGSFGRAALTSATILVLHQFLAGVLGQPGGWLPGALRRVGIELSLWPVVAVLAIVQLAAIALAYDSRISEHRILNSVELGTLDRVIAHILGLSADFFDARTHGELIQSVRTDVANLRLVVGAQSTLLLEVSQAVGLIAVATRLSPALALWTFLLIPIAVVPITISARRTLVASWSLRRRNAAVFDTLLQLIHGVRIIKIYAAEDREAATMSARSRRFFGELEEMEHMRALARVAIDSMAAVTTIVVAVVGAVRGP